MCFPMGSMEEGKTEQLKKGAERIPGSLADTAASGVLCYEK